MTFLFTAIPGYTTQIGCGILESSSSGLEIILAGNPAMAANPAQAATEVGIARVFSMNTNVWTDLERIVSAEVIYPLKKTLKNKLAQERVRMFLPRPIG